MLSTVFNFSVSPPQETCQPQRAQIWSWRGRGSSCRTLSSCPCLTPGQMARWTGPTWWTLPRPLRVSTRCVFLLEIIESEGYLQILLFSGRCGNCHIYSHQKRALLVRVCSTSKSNNMSLNCFLFRAEAGLPRSPGGELHGGERSSSHQPPAG